MNLLLFESSETAKGNRLLLSDHRATHVQQVLKLKVGDPVRVGEIGGKIGLANVIANGVNGVIELQIQSLDVAPPKISPVELILGLPRPKGLRRIMKAAANIGIKSIHLINSGRVDKSYWSAPALRPEIMRATLLEGLSIAKDTTVPTVYCHKLFKPFAQDVAPQISRRHAFVAHPSELSTPLEPALSSTGTILLAVGPEGGFTEYELGLFIEAGFEVLSLGPRVLSVESAIPTLETFLRTRSESCYSSLELNIQQSPKGRKHD